MAYHVFHDKNSNAIFAGTTNKTKTKWINKSEVTEEALAATREHLLGILRQQEDNPTMLGYEWEYPDGTHVILEVKIKEKEEKNDSDS